MSFFKKLFGGKSDDKYNRDLSAFDDDVDVREEADVFSAPNHSGLDFSDVTSIEQSRALAEEGRLFPIHLMPLEFGGQDIPLNILYVPPGVPEVKDQITAMIYKLANDGIVTNMTVKPSYKGNSLIPSRIYIETFSDANSGSFNPTIEIW